MGMFATVAVFSAAFFAHASDAPVAPINGDGSAVNPYQMTEIGNFVWLKDQCAAGKFLTRNVSYKLMNDINASETIYWNGEQGFIPIGWDENGYRFEGKFNGNGKRILGLGIARPSTRCVGLFGVVAANAKIYDLGVVSGNVKGGQYTGAMVGLNRGAAITKCYSQVNVTGSQYVGGLVGATLDGKGTYTDCYAHGVVTGVRYAGGLVGGANCVAFNNCYSDCKVVATSEDEAYAGGLIGYNQSSAINSCHACGFVTGSAGGDYVGGLVGLNTGYINNCYYMTGDVIGGDHVGGLVGLSLTKSIADSYVSDFVSVSGYRSVGGLVGAAVGTNVNYCWVNSTVDVDGESSLGGFVGTAVTATFGNNNTGAAVIGNSAVGGFIGSADTASTMTLCSATGEVNGDEYVGGFCGAAYSSEVTCQNCYAQGEVSGDGYAGGFAGWNEGTLDKCYAAGGAVTATSNASGLVGYNKGTVTYCYWDADTTGQNTSSGSPASYGKTTLEMMQKDTYSTWDFDNIWDVYTGANYPFFRTGQQMGSMTVTILPVAAATAGAKWSLDGRSWQSSGTTVPVCYGVHTVLFKDTDGYATPSMITTNVSGAKTLTVTYKDQPNYGSLCMSLGPAAAVTAGAQWAIDDLWYDSDQTVHGLPTGTYTVFFKGIRGWIAPVVQTVTIKTDTLTSKSAVYTPSTVQVGSLCGTLLPATAIQDGARWRVDGGAWLTSGQVVTNLAVGSHLVTFSDLVGWDTPAALILTVNAGQTTYFTGNYSFTSGDRGSLRVSLTPDGAVLDGARWCIDATDVWYGSDYVKGSIPVGEHVITFATIDGWDTPAPQVVTITKDTVTYATGNYVLTLPDIVLEDSDFTSGILETLTPGDPVDLSWTASTTLGFSDPFWCEVFASKTGGFDLERLGATITSSYVKSGLSGTETIAPRTLILNPVSDGRYTLVPSVNRGSLAAPVTESVYTNNWMPIAGKRLQVHNTKGWTIDLTLENVGITVDQADNKRLTVSGQVLNIGTTALEKPGCWLEVFYGTLTAEGTFMPQGTIGPGLKFDSLPVNAPQNFTLSGSTPIPAIRKAYAVVIDSTQIVPESAEANNWVLKYDSSVLPAGKSNGIDLEVTELNIAPTQLAPASVTPGSKLDFSVTVLNKGTVMPAGQVYLELFASKDGGVSLVSGNTLTWSTLIDAPALGETKTYTLSKTIKSIGDGIYTPVVIVNRAGAGANPGDETPLDNIMVYNAGRVFLSTPLSTGGTKNIVWSEGPYFSQVGTQMTITGKIKNEGDTRTCSFWTEAFIGTFQVKTGFFYKDTAVVFSAGDSCPGLGAGEEHSVTLTGTVPAGKFVGVLADSTDVVDETDETNNYEYSGLTE